MSKELEDRFFNFAKQTRNFCGKLRWNVINLEYIKQLIRSSGSIGANYIEASDDLGKSDERMKLKIARREAKETAYWLSLVLTYENEELKTEQFALIEECNQIKKILSSILIKLTI